MQKRILIFTIALVALFSVSLTALAENMILNLRGGDKIAINCNGYKLNLTRLNKNKVKAECKGAASGQASSAPNSLNLRGGDNAEINCDGSKLDVTRVDPRRAKAECQGAAPIPTNTPVPPTNTPVPSPTNTPA